MCYTVENSTIYFKSTLNFVNRSTPNRPLAVRCAERNGTLMKTIIATNNAPAAIGPYSQATKYNGLIFVSGQLPLDPATGELSQAPIGQQTELVMHNIEAILKEAGSDLSKVLKTTIFVADLADFGAVNEAYGKFFPQNPPARACFQVAQLPKNAKIEIEVICAE